MLFSLRAKIFAAAGLLLAVLAGAVLPLTQTDMSATVEAAEQHAVANTLELVLRDTEARWGSLLDDKFRSIRGARAQMMELSATLHSVLQSYADLAQQGVMSATSARFLARRWLNGLQLGEQRQAVLYDAGLRVLAASNPKLIGTDLSALEDIKGRQMARSMLAESQLSNSAFALYRSAGSGGGAPETHYAHFAYFAPWGWVLALTGNAQEILDLVADQRAHMQAALQNTLGSLVLARSGFVFIVNDAGELVVPPPPKHAALLRAPTQGGEDLLQNLTKQQTPEQSLLLDYAHEPWTIRAVRHKPLGWVLAAAVPQSDFTAAARRLVQRQALLFGLALAIALALAWLVATRISRPLNTLTRYARSLPQQDLTDLQAPPQAVARLAGSQRDEVGRLAASFLFMQEQLGSNISRLMQETSSRERIESELNIARDIQLGLLPVPLPAAVKQRIDLHASMQPAKEVGGDLYDYFLLADGRLCFAIGDVSGKGVPAALFMAVTRTLIRASAEGENDPARIVRQVNNRLAENNPNMMFVSLLLGVLDLDSGALQWVNAGHPPPALIDAHGARLLPGRSGPACGVQEDLDYQLLHAQLLPEQVFFAYTDGVTDATDAAGAQYTEARMLARLQARCAGATAQAEALLADVQKFADSAEPFDDITLLVLRRPPFDAARGA